MRIVAQRVSQASVTIDGVLKSQIGKGMMVLLGIEDADNEEDVEYLCQKLTKLRIFADDDVEAVEDGEYENHGERRHRHADDGYPCHDIDEVVAFLRKKITLRYE